MPRLERLSPEHPIQSFVSANDDLDGWLQRAALTADRAGTARVYLWLDDEGGVIGYFAILPHNIRREAVTRSSCASRPAPDV